MSKDKHNNLEKAEILFNSLLRGKIDSSLDYQTYEQVFLPIILNELKKNVMIGNSEAYYLLARVYEVEFNTHKKDEYVSILLTLAGHKLGNVKCSEIVNSNYMKYENFELNIIYL